MQRLAELKAEVGRLWQDMDVLVVPTIGTTFTVDGGAGRAHRTNTMLGHYTHFGNLLDLSGSPSRSGPPPTAGPPAPCCSGRPCPMTSSWPSEH